MGDPKRAKIEEVNQEVKVDGSPDGQVGVIERKTVKAGVYLSVLASPSWGGGGWDFPRCGGPINRLLDNPYPF